MRFSIGKPNQREYHACRDLQGEHIWCCDATLVQAAQTESPGSPQPSLLALGKLSPNGRSQGDPQPARQPPAPGCGWGERCGAGTSPTPRHGVGSTTAFH